MNPATWEVIVIGAGAAGLMAATRAAECGRRTLLLEKNTRPGLKILMSGGTRCNITQSTDTRGIIAAFGAQGRFLHSALAAFGVDDALDFFAAEGVATKVEPTGKVFPVSDRAADVLAALLARLGRSGCELVLGEPLVDLAAAPGGFRLTTTGRELLAEKVILTTGGKSYPGSGTTGDGYAWAASFGHTIVTPRPALTPITVAEEWPRELRGITLPDVGVRILERNANQESRSPRDATMARPEVALDARRGSLLFTHFGLSGPVVLDVSRVVSGHAAPQRLTLELDLAPQLEAAAFADWLRQRSAEAGKRLAGALVPGETPRRLVDQVLLAAGIPATRKAAELTREERNQLTAACKRLPLRLTGTLGFKKAEVTAGGVALAEVDSRTLESKLAPGLHFAGEVLDLDGPIGGYNFQAAWSTGWLAGGSV